MDNELLINAWIPESLLVLDDPVVVDPLVALLLPGCLDLILVKGALDDRLPGYFNYFSLHYNG